MSSRAPRFFLLFIQQVTNRLRGRPREPFFGNPPAIISLPNGGSQGPLRRFDAHENTLGERKKALFYL